VRANLGRREAAATCAILKRRRFVRIYADGRPAAPCRTMGAMFRKILVLVRGRDPAQPALQRAALCASSNTELVLLDVVHEPLLDGYLGNTEIYEPLRARVVAERSEYVQELVAALLARGLEVTGKAVWDHPLDEAVAKEVRARGADLVVIARPGPGVGGLSHSDWRLISTCPAPVLVVRGSAEHKYRHIVAAVDPFHTHAKPAKLDLAILDQARELQAQTGATLRAIHCFAPFEYFGANLPMSANQTSGEDVRRAELENILRKSDLQAAAARLETGATHEVIKRLAEDGEADVVVMGALARGRIKDWLIGSTAERVLHDARVDVLAVKPRSVR
jgi:universal stress protein E